MYCIKEKSVGSTPIDEINAFFLLKLNKRPMKEVLEKRMNKIAARRTTDMWVVKFITLIFFILYFK